LCCAEGTDAEGGYSAIIWKPKPPGSKTHSLQCGLIASLPRAPSHESKLNTGLTGFDNIVSFSPSADDPKPRPRPRPRTRLLHTHLTPHVQRFGLPSSPATLCICAFSSRASPTPPLRIASRQIRSYSVKQKSHAQYAENTFLRDDVHGVFRFCFDLLVSVSQSPHLYCYAAQIAQHRAPLGEALGDDASTCSLC
jgi:hypothetical protein